ncbi:anaphase promoting complex subunit cdc16 [Nowakowskiella sp. JEL0407]|nr:anaphase promoting complex subunit cdc16 [Nowakowskiella sp. JEL0407]
MPSPPLDTLRKWREQAINSHNLTMADFFANKICSFSKDLEDLYWLAQIYYLGGHYTRIEKLLSNSEIYDSLKCVYLLALSLIKLDKFEESHSLLSKYEYFDPSLVEQQPVGQDEYENVKIESLLCFLCGVCFLKRSTPVRAKNCFVRALKVDVKCFEAYDRLMSLDMLTADEEQELFNSLNFERDCGPASDFIKTLYQTKLKKIGVIPEIQRSIEILEDQYDLKSNLDVVLTKAQVEFLAFRFENCLKLTREIIKKDEINQTALPIHISCLFVLEKKSDLMLYSHELSEKYPGEAATWFAVGVYYLAKQANVESRQHFR